LNSASKSIQPARWPPTTAFSFRVGDFSGTLHAFANDVFVHRNNHLDIGGIVSVGESLAVRRCVDGMQMAFNLWRASKQNQNSYRRLENEHHRIAFPDT
jgi:hypothetical protein